MAPDIDPLDLISPHHYGTRGVPHASWTLLRQHAPVHWCEPEGFEPFWAITKHADIMDISGRPGTFSNAADGIVVFSDETRRQVVEDGEQGFANMRTIIEMDPPEHREFRRVASPFFTPRGVQRLDAIVEQSARALLDSLGEEGECDFVEKIAQRHPLRVLSRILGIDESDEERVLELTQQLFAADDPDLQRKGEDRRQAIRELGLEFFQLFHRIVEDRRANPRDDLASMLANGRLANGERMPDMETFGYYLIVFTAGHDTTRNALAGGIEALIQHPDQLARLCAEPALAKSAVEEVVRWTSPVNYMKRTALHDVELHGRKIREGDRLVLFYASANRDEDVFADPFDFRIDRQPNRHLGFGTGEHYCLGAHVARKSSLALLRELAARTVRLEPAGEATQIHSSFVVGRKNLPVRYVLRKAA